MIKLMEEPTVDHIAQVGGTHYSQGDNPQHWDLVSMYGWDYFQAQIVKYLMRWKVKHDSAERRLEDLKKARSFLDKYISIEEKFVPQKQKLDTVPEPTPFTGTTLPVEGTAHWSNEGYYADGTQLYKCAKCRRTVRAAHTPAPCGCGVGYPTPAAPQVAGRLVQGTWPPLI